MWLFSIDEQIGEQTPMTYPYPFRFRVKPETTCSSKKFVRLLLCVQMAMTAIRSPSLDQSRETRSLKVYAKVQRSSLSRIQGTHPTSPALPISQKKKNPYCFHLCSHSFDVFLQFFHVFCKSVPQLVELESNGI